MSIKVLSTIAVFILGVTVFGFDGFPPGTYTGTGVLRDSKGSQTNFHIKSVITQTGQNTQSQTDTYTMPSGEIDLNRYDIVIDTSGTLGVFRDGTKRGFGYCFQGACHLKYNFPDTHVSGEETLISTGSSIYRIGTRSFQGGQVAQVRTTLTKVK